MQHMFKHADKADYRLTQVDIDSFKKNQAASYHTHQRLCKWENAVKFVMK